MNFDWFFLGCDRWDFGVVAGGPDSGALRLRQHATVQLDGPHRHVQHQRAGESSVSAAVIASETHHTVRENISIQQFE